MTMVLFASTYWHYVMGTLLFITAVFLILLVLVQRGRGGGLSGALGGMGGQSAFGTKAGDMFTRVTMVTAFVWIFLCAATIKLVGSQTPWGSSSSGKQKTTAPSNPGAETPGGDSDSAKTSPDSSGADSQGAEKEAAPSGSEAGHQAAPETPRTADQPETPAKQ